MDESRRPETSSFDSNPALSDNLERVSIDLDIMERHASELAAVEAEIQEGLRRWDREFKDAHLHSIPKGRKHLR